jgi:disulfide oxidoreductase YuzD
MLADCNNIVDEQLSLLSAKDSEIIVLKQQKETLTSIIKNKDIIISKQDEYIKQEEQLIERLKHNYDKKDKKEYIYPSIVVGAFILGAIIAN